MAQSCKVCGHGQLQAINAELVANRSGLRAIAAQYGVSKDSLSRHWRAHVDEPRQTTELKQLTEPQTATSEPEPDMDRYDAFIERFSGKRVSRAEVATWGYDPGELALFIQVALECGDLSSS